MKELPKVFANPIDKNVSHNSTRSYGKLENEIKIRDERIVIEKLNKLFRNDQMVYSIDCEITFSTHKNKYTIIGRTNNHLLTKTQKMIPIKDIYDIELA